MTEYELHSLISEQMDLSYANFETWLGVTVGVLLAGFYGKGYIGLLLRKIIIGLYLTAGTLIISNLIQITYTIGKYMEVITSLGAMEYPFQPITAVISGVASFTVLILGTLSATLYFFRATIHENETAN
jgi:hypothetical protein